MTIRVLLADDQEIVRAGLTTLLNRQPGIEVIAQAGDGREAAALARRLRPDVCLFDIRMPHLDGVESTRLLGGPEVEDPLAVVVITAFDTDDHVRGALRAGARGFLLKDSGPVLLAQAVRAAAEGDALIAPRVTSRLLASFAHAPRGWAAISTRCPAHPARGGGAAGGLSRPDQRGARLRALSQPEHRQVPPGQPDEQDRRAEPRPDRHLGV